MFWSFKYLLVLSLVSPIFTAELLKFLNPPQYDGVKRVCQLTASSVTSQLLSKHAAGLIIKIKDSSQSPTCAWLELTAQLVQKRNISVCEVTLDVTNVPVGSPLEGTQPGDVLILLNNQKQVYYGRRCPTAILSFLHKHNNMAQVKLITGKLDKLAYDKVEGPKIVGFFAPNTPELAAFELAASKNPSVPFYMATDSIVAKHLKLSTVGQVMLVKQLEKLRKMCPVNPATTADIELLIQGDHGLNLKHLTEHNMYDPKILDQNRTTFLAIGDKSSAIGGYFHRLMMKVVRNLTKPIEKKEKPAKTTVAEETTAEETVAQEAPALPAEPVVEEPPVNVDSVDIVWLDTNQFPMVQLMMDDLEQVLKFPANQQFHFGAINASANVSAWFNTAVINTTADKVADEENIQLMRQFIVSVANKSVTPTTISGEQAIVQSPVDVQVNEGQDFVLECGVANQIGDCLWLHDGQNIGFNLARLGPHYGWRKQIPVGDCALQVKVAEARDAGRWECQVTGDQKNPTVTSAPAIVTVVIGTQEKVIPATGPNKKAEL